LEFDGDDHVFAGDIDPPAGDFEQFLATVPLTVTDQALATVLFADIVC